jgi:Acetoacetate decarboxylase (ADC)/Enoyl-(Acyl carrier protein) reductase
MKEDEVRSKAFAMPLTNPAYPIGPYRFYNREYLIITYRTNLEKLREVVPEPLQVDEPLVKYEFIRMPDSTGFGDYTESGQVIPVSFKGRKGGYTHCMFLKDHPPIAGGRELWGFPKKLAKLKGPYVSAKHALLGLARVVAKEGAEHGVRANVICPGFVRTPLVDKQIPEQAKELGISEQEVIDNVMLKDTVDHEFTTVADVAETALFLATFKSNALTGQSVIVSHGWFME